MIGLSARAILARLDGALDVSDVAALCGLSEEEVARVLEPLIASGLVAMGDAPAPVASRAPHTIVPPGISGDGRVSSAEMTLPVLAEDEQRRIADLYAKLNKIDHYRLLGVAATADTKAIKRAYFALAKLYHPDRFFGRDLGAVRPKVEAIFAAMTTAIDTLSDSARRRTYDAYLREVLKTRIARRTAEALEGQKDWAGAADVWARVVEALPADPYVHHRHAYALLRARTSFDVALVAATRAIELDPARAEYRVTAAMLYLAIGRERSAIGELEVVLGIEPDRLDVAGLLAAVTERVARGRS